MSRPLADDRQETDGATLILFVTGEAPRSRRARLNLSAALEAAGVDDLALREVDLLRDPEQAIAFSVFATPALVHLDDTGASRVLYGDLSDDVGLRRFLASVTPS